MAISKILIKAKSCNRTIHDDSQMEHANIVSLGSTFSSLKYQELLTLSAS